MTIKGFKVGQTVYVMGDGRTMMTKYDTSVAEVVKIGRKYVTISGAWGLQFKETSDRRPYLIEHTEYGAPHLLFPSQEAVDEYREREELKTWVREAAGWDRIDRYTLAQLREVKRILGQESPGNGPLTLVELEGMVGERVWVEAPGAREYGCYRVVEGVDHKEQALLTAGDFTCYNYGELGAWQAYRQKPDNEGGAT